MKTKVVPNLIFNSWTVLSRAGNAPSGVRTWNCRCSCGTEAVVTSSALLQGRSKQCRPCANQHKASQLVGQTFGAWTVIQRMPNDPTMPHTQWLCRCSCGTERIIPATNLKQSNSLGCLRCAQANRSAIHPINVAFSHVKCNALKRRLSFNVTKEQVYEIMQQQNFKCALTGIELTLNCKDKYYKGCNASLDRIDSNRGYELNNVQWVYKPINNMKWKLPQDEFIRLCRLVVANSSQR
jgi:hypothetical protein